jgi:hypothetical protein
MLAMRFNHDGKYYLKVGTYSWRPSLVLKQIFVGMPIVVLSS